MTKKSTAGRLVLAITAIISASQVWRVILLLLVIVVGFLALIPAQPKSMDLGWDKLNHMAAFATLTGVGYLGFPAALRHRFFIFFGLFAYGCAIEICQLLVPGRSCEWGDLLADSVGIACGAFIAGCLTRGLPKHLRTSDRH
ncbi:MAG: VanZ family protein [Pseudomonadota bacterium]